MNYLSLLLLAGLLSVGCEGSSSTAEKTGDAAPDSGDTETADTETADTETGDTETGDTGGSDEETWEQRSLYYLREARVCTSTEGVAQETGKSDPYEAYAFCSFDSQCGEDFPICRHLSLASNGQDASAFYPPLVSPPRPEDQNASGYRIRYAPLFEDGSGNHEHALELGGVTPTCEPEDYIRCADGTRARYYTKPGSGDHAGDFIVWAGSGGHSQSAGANTWAMMHLSQNSYGLKLVPTAQRAGLEGIFGDSAGGTAFADTTRVYVDKCTPDRWIGKQTQRVPTMSFNCSDLLEEVEDGDEIPDCAEGVAAPLDQDGFEVELYLHGDRIVKAVLSDLASGVDLYDDYEAATPTVAISVQPITGSSQVLLTCWSNGCNGLHTTVDERADFLDALAPGVDVRAVFNSFFAAAPEGEWTIDETSPSLDVFAGHSLYEHVFEGNSIARDEAGVNRPISDFTYRSGGQRENLDFYGVALDASCVALHSEDPTPCYDTMHVLTNHLETPFFYNFAQSDSSIGQGKKYPAPYCETEELRDIGCDFNGVEKGYQHMVRKQAVDIYLHAEDSRCEAASGSGAYDRIFLWAPSWSSHSAWDKDDNCSYQLGPSLDTTVSLRQAVYLWATDTVTGKQLYLENDPSVHTSARNDALGVSNCFNGN